MAKFTFLEVHLEDADFTASAPFAPGEKAIEAGEEPPEEPAEGGRAMLLAALVGVAFLVVVAFLVKRRVLDGGDAEFDGALEDA